MPDRHPPACLLDSANCRGLSIQDHFCILQCLNQLVFCAATWCLVQLTQQLQHRCSAALDSGLHTIMIAIAVQCSAVQVSTCWCLAQFKTDVSYTGTVAESLATKSHPAARSNAPNSPSCRAISPNGPAPRGHAAKVPLPKSPAARAPAANRPAVEAMAHNKLAVKALEPGPPAANVPTSTRTAGNSSGASVLSASNTAVAVSSAGAVEDVGTASSPAAANGPGTSGLTSFPLAEQCGLGRQEEEEQAQEDEDEIDEDTDDELCSDEDLSSWGSDEEIWGSDSDFYDTDDEEEGPMAGQYIPNRLLCYAAFSHEDCLFAH